MRYLVLTDIHANLEALDICLADANAQGFEQTLVLGDLVGYGPDPNGVIDRIKALNPIAMIRGNHDKVACGLEQPEGFNAVARSNPRSSHARTARCTCVGWRTGSPCRTRRRPWR